MNQPTRKEREQRAGEVAPAPANAVIVRIAARITWLERELANVAAWQEELAMLKRMHAAASSAAPRAKSTHPHNKCPNGLIGCQACE